MVDDSSTSPPDLHVKHVLVPLDGSESSLRAMLTARVLAERFGAELQTVSVGGADAADRLRVLGVRGSGRRHWGRAGVRDRGRPGRDHCAARKRTGSMFGVPFDPWPRAPARSACGFRGEVGAAALGGPGRRARAIGRELWLVAPSAELAGAAVRAAHRGLRRRFRPVRASAAFGGGVGARARHVDDDPHCRRRHAASVGTRAREEPLRRPPRLRELRRLAGAAVAHHRVRPGRRGHPESDRAGKRCARDTSASGRRAWLLSRRMRAPVCSGCDSELRPRTSSMPRWPRASSRPCVADAVRLFAPDARWLCRHVDDAPAGRETARRKGVTMATFDKHSWPSILVAPHPRRGAIAWHTRSAQA